MSPRIRKPRVPSGAVHALVFAALGDTTRLRLISSLCERQPRSIMQLTAGTRLTRQAVTKHLHVLEHAGLVHGIRRGRERLIELNPQPLAEARDYLSEISTQWDRALTRLKAFVER